MKNKAFPLILLCIGIIPWAACVGPVPAKLSFEMARAIADGDVEALTTILKSNPEAVKARNKDKVTPLHCCADRPVLIPGDKSTYSAWLANSDTIAAFLIAHGADVNAGDVFNQTPLHYAARSGNTEVAKVLLANKADVNSRDLYRSTALHITAWNGNTAFARLLIEKGADVNAMDKMGTPLTTAVEENRDMVELLLNSRADVQMKNPDGFAPIHLAGNRDIAQLLFTHGTKLEISGYHDRTPLHLAAMRNRNDVVEWLCVEGVKVNTVDYDGQTPLLISISQPGNTECAAKRSLETIRILLRNGANVNYQDAEGLTLLHVAVRRNREDIVDLLVHHGAEINAKDKYGYTPLHWAVSGKNKEMVEMLVSRGADVNSRSLQGRTPLYDTWGGSVVEVQIADILKEHGGIK